MEFPNSKIQSAALSSGVSLKDTLANCQIFGADDIHVSSCCHDWNLLQPGDLYVARVGMEADGHDHISIAAKKGASAILSERFIVSEIPVCLVNDTREAYGEICQRLVGSPKDQLQLIGVTGTTGKSTVSMLLQSILKKAGMRAGSITSLGFCDGFVTTPTQQTTPQPPQLADQLGELVANGCNAAIIESSSQGIAERRLSGIEFDACVYTNIKQDHLDAHGTVDNYRRLKTRLADRLKPTGFIVANADDRFLNRWIDVVNSPALTYGMKNPAEITAEKISQSIHEQTFLLIAGNESIPVRTPFIGDYFIQHCLAAATVALTMDVQLEEIVAGLEQVHSIPGRMERISSGQPYSIFVDQADTSAQLREMLKSLRKSSSSGRVRCLFGGSPRLYPEERASLGVVAEKYADETIVTSVDDFQDTTLDLSHDVLDGFKNVNRTRVIPNRVAAIKYLLETSNPDDRLLIAGMGNRPTTCRAQNESTETDEFSFTDRQLCEAWLEDPTSLDPLIFLREDTQPICYPIDDYR